MRRRSGHLSSEHLVIGKTENHLSLRGNETLKKLIKSPNWDCSNHGERDKQGEN